MSSLRSRSGGSWIGDDVQPVEQVLAEPALLHHLPQVDVGRGDDPHVDLDRLHAAQAHELALLHDAQQLGLRLERDVADLVEEDAALVGQLEEPLLRVDGAGERALDVAEEVRLEQVRRQVARVDGDERPGRRAASCVWMARATSSLPVPLSPSIRIVDRLGAAWMIRSKTCRIRGLRPMMLSNWW